MIFFQQLHYTGRGTGQEAFFAHKKLSGIEWVKTIHVFIRRNGFQHLTFVQMRRKGQLHNDAVDILPPIQFLHKRQKLSLSGVFRQVISFTVNAALFTISALSPDVHMGCGVLPHQDHRQTRTSRQTCRLLPHPLLDLLRQCFSVKGRHALSPLPLSLLFYLLSSD